MYKSIKVRAAVAALILAPVAILSAASVRATDNPLPVLPGPIRIMIAGDSTAAGVPVGCGDGTWYGERSVLGSWLHDVGGIDIEMVGSQVSGCGQPWNHHEGRPGDTIVNLAAHIAGYLQATPADILILRVGVNDATSWSGWRTAQQMAADYTTLIETARAQSPGIRILASEIIPPDGAVSADLARASVTARKFNKLLPGIAAPYGDSVHIAHTGMITPLWLADGLHPSGQGYVGIAWIMMQQPDALWPWLSADPPPATKPWDVPLDPWRG